MATNLFFSASFLSDELELDELIDRRGSSKRNHRHAGKQRAGGKGKKALPLQRYTTLSYDFEVIALEDDYSVVPGNEPGNYFTHPHFEKERAQQRAIRPAMTRACLCFGEHAHVAASIHCTVTDQSVADARRLGFDISDLRGLELVLVGKHQNVVKTGYWIDVPSSRRAA